MDAGFASGAGCRGYGAVRRYLPQRTTGRVRALGNGVRFRRAGALGQQRSCVLHLPGALLRERREVAREVGLRSASRSRGSWRRAAPICASRQNAKRATQKNAPTTRLQPRCWCRSGSPAQVGSRSWSTTRLRNFRRACCGASAARSPPAHARRRAGDVPGRRGRSRLRRIRGSAWRRKSPPTCATHTCVCMPSCRKPLARCD